MASQNRPVAHFHLAGQRNAVDQYAVVTDRTVMSYMHISHNQRIASDCRHALGRRAPTDRRALANRRIVADHGRRILALELQVLRQTGRFPTVQAGTYWLRVVDKKFSRGKTYVIAENCMNGLQKPALAAMLRHELGGGTPAPYEPLFTSEWAFPIIAHGDESRTETVDIVGNLCCAADVLTEDFTAPELAVGDLIEVRNAGAYACTLTAQRFSSHQPPRELLVYGDGRVETE